MDYWDRRCAVTGVDQGELLRASHIKPWARCANDAERLDPHNGLLLVADWDAAVDAGLLTFGDGGEPAFSVLLAPAAKVRLGHGLLPCAYGPCGSR